MPLKSSWSTGFGIVFGIVCTCKFVYEISVWIHFSFGFDCVILLASPVAGCVCVRACVRACLGDEDLTTAQTRECC